MDKLKEYLKENSQEELHHSEIANFLKSLDDKNFYDSIGAIPKELIALVLFELPDRYFSDVIEAFSVEDLVASILELESDDKTDFIQELEYTNEELAKRVFELLPKEVQEEISRLKRYSEDEAGAYMQVEVYTAGLEKTVKGVIEDFARLRKKNELENVQYLFVTNKQHKLYYGIGLDALLIFDFDKTLKENIEESPEKFKIISSTDRENIYDVVQKFQEYDLNSMPIINSKGVLIGRITSDDIYDIMNEQATDQIYHLAGINNDEDDIIKAGKDRALWLSINLLTAILASLVIGIFEETLSSFVALAVLMPIVASMGGNAGTQTLTVVVRQLALGDIAKNDAFKTIKKEVILSLFNGFLFAIIMGIIASIWFDKGILGLVIAISMIVNLLIAGLFGAIIPLLLKKMQIDPAIGSTVILTTVTDVVGFFSFLGLATIILF